MTTPAPPRHGFDPEAEQEVDFARYGRMLAVRWWLLAAGLVAGAVIGYLISLGGSQVYSATATLYLGQPYSGAQSSLPVISPQVNPAAVGTIVNAQSVDNAVAASCHAKTSEFKKGISTQAVSSSSSSTKSSAPINPLVKVSVQAKKGKVAACAATSLARKAVEGVGQYVAAKISNFQSHIAFDNSDIKTIETAIANPSISSTDKLFLETTLRQDQLDKTTTTQLLLQATQIERPHLLTAAAAQKVTARSRRNTVVVAALIGLILGVLAALLWDRVVPRLVPRNGD